MGLSKRKNAKPPPQMRSRTTRSKGKPLPDPEENSQLLTEQLCAMGLYAAPTLGDGNCLFRALSDQLYGTPSYHLKLRHNICNWIESHKQRYEPFVDDERGLDVHLQCMRQPATYGGHLELSAFAHMMKRNVKVVQPGLVYVIEWAAGGEHSADASTPSPSSPTPTTPNESVLNDREKRRLMRDRRRSEMEKSSQPDSEASTGPIYVAYHDWEHFSSIRSLRGPHNGLPNVVESPAPTAAPTPVKRSASKAKPTSRAASKHTSRMKVVTETAAAQTPSQIPLPGSRSPSPISSSAPPSQTFPSSPIPELSPSAPSLARTFRSPKRTFDESSASSQAPSESSQSAAKRAKSSSRAPSRSRADDMLVDEVELYLDTPELSASGSSPASTSSLSSVPSPSGTPPPMPAPEPPVEPERRLTRRQRKVLGLPKPRAAFVASTMARRASAGKIIIPGGKYKKPTAGRPAAEDEDGESGAEWKHNGTGRVDVRGFRELKI